MSSRKRLSDLLDSLERRGEMHLQPFNYKTLVAFLSGYDTARVETGASSDLENFARWLDGRVGHHCSMNWAAVVRDLFASGDEERAVPVLFDLFREFGEESGSDNASVAK